MNCDSSQWIAIQVIQLLFKSINCYSSRCIAIRVNELLFKSMNCYFSQRTAIILVNALLFKSMNCYSSHSIAVQVDLLLFNLMNWYSTEHMCPSNRKIVRTWEDTNDFGEFRTNIDDDSRGKILLVLFLEEARLYETGPRSLKRSSGSAQFFVRSTEHSRNI
jgi:hypothetical protein